MSFDELIQQLRDDNADDIADAIEDVCELAGTTDADWCILRAAGELIASLRSMERGISP